MTTAVIPKVRLNPPPPRLMRIVNPLVRRVLTSRILGPRVKNIAVVEFVGRRTGRRLRVPMGLQMIDGVPTAFTCRAWRLNFAGGAPVTVMQRAQPRRAWAILLDATPEQLGTALRQALDNGASPFDLGLKVARRHQPTVAELGAVNLSMIQFHARTTTARQERP